MTAGPEVRLKGERAALAAEPIAKLPMSARVRRRQLVRRECPRHEEVDAEDGLPAAALEVRIRAVDAGVR